MSAHRGGSQRGSVSCDQWLPKGMLGYTPTVDRILDTRLWKHSLPASTVADGKNLLNSSLGLRMYTQKYSLASMGPWPTVFYSCLLSSFPCLFNNTHFQLNYEFVFTLQKSSSSHIDTDTFVGCSVFTVSTSSGRRLTITQCLSNRICHSHIIPGKPI